MNAASIKTKANPENLGKSDAGHLTGCTAQAPESADLATRTKEGGEGDYISILIGWRVIALSFPYLLFLKLLRYSPLCLL